MDEILEQELHVDEALQPQDSGNIELLPFGSSSGEFNSLPYQEQQSGDTEVMQEELQQPKNMEIEHDTATQEPLYLNLVVENSMMELKNQTLSHKNQCFLKHLLKQ